MGSLYSETTSSKSYLWKHLERYERKNWHKNNNAAIARGKGLLNKNKITWKDFV